MMPAEAGRDWHGRDYYAILGVPVTASPDEIARAYRRLARTTHPDADLDNPGSAERFDQLTAAREILGDPVARAAYDRIRARRSDRNPTAGPASDPVVRDDPAEDVGSRGRNRGDPRRPTGATIRVGPVIWTPSRQRRRDG